jgi:hypothetical protein
MPSSNYYSYISLHSYINPHIKYETLKTFSKLQLIFGLQEIFKYVVNVFKQSCEQFKLVYISIDMYYEY